MGIIAETSSSTSPPNLYVLSREVHNPNGDDEEDARRGINI